jgi:hypothetical protein
MLDRTRLGRVLVAYEAYYRLTDYISKTFYSAGMTQRFLLRDENGFVNSNILEMMEIILETNIDTNIKDITTYIPEFIGGKNIIRAQLGDWIAELVENRGVGESERENYIINASKIIDYLFRNLKIFLITVSEGTSKITNTQIRSMYSYKFPEEIDLVFFLMIMIPKIHKGMIDDSMIDKFIQILKVDDDAYRNIKNQCNRGLVFIESDLYYTCLYTTEGKGLTKKEIILQNTKGLKTLTSLRYNAFEISTSIGLLTLVKIMIVLRESESASRPKRSSVLARRPVVLSLSRLGTPSTD